MIQDDKPIDWDQVDALYDKASDAEVTGDTSQAIALYRKLLSIDPADHLGVSLRLGRLDQTTPAKAPDAYVATLFDQVADRFDSILVDELGYAVPLMIAEALRSLDVPASRRWLDLGCGTGLCAMALEEMTAHCVGVDLAPTMIEIADELDIYDELYIAEVVDFLTRQPADQPFDLISAADVLPYIGALEPLFEALDPHTDAASTLAFSSEWLDGSVDKPYALGQHKRFAHSTAYRAQILERFGWQCRHVEMITVRLEQGDPVSGELVIAQKTAA